MSELQMLYTGFHVVVAVAFGYFILCMGAMNSTHMSWPKTVILSILWPLSFMYIAASVLIIKIKPRK